MANIFIALFRVSSTRCRGKDDNSARQRGRKGSGEEMRFQLGLGCAAGKEGKRKKEV